jgi:DNA-binding CsgD family transcriptional regulator
MIEAIADWCDALHGGQPLDSAFGRLVLGLGAEAGVLVRTHSSDLRPSRIAVWDGAGAASPPASFADGCFGHDLVRAKAVTIWLASAHEGEAAAEADPALAAWQSRRGLREFAVLVLSAGNVRDHIELHFRAPLPTAAQATLATVLPTIARTWASRQVGLVTRAVIGHRLRQSDRCAGPARTPLLSIENPARLSRAEFRVCLLLSRGLSMHGVAEALSLSEATIRSHLRSIYAKTETSGLAELVFHLLERRPGADGLERRIA